MGNQVDNRTNYDIIKNYAINRYRAAQKSIEDQLFRWAGISPGGFRKRQHRECNPKWTHETNAMFDLLDSFNSFVDKTEQAGADILNWQCGLCQMIDTHNEAVCEVLPVLLTTYLYAFAGNDFVNQFLGKINVEEYPYIGKKVIYGAEKPPEDYMPGPNDDVGIGKLLFEYAIDDKETRQELHSLVEFFDSQKLVSQSLKDNLIGTQLFIMPKAIKGKFRSGCSKKAFKISRTKKQPNDDFGGVITKATHRFEAPPAGYEFYSKARFLSCLGHFYTVQKRNCQFIKEPNSLLCWILINEEINDKEELNQIERNCNQFDEQVLVEHYSLIYDDLVNFGCVLI